MSQLWFFAGRTEVQMGECTEFDGFATMPDSMTPQDILARN